MDIHIRRAASTDLGALDELLSQGDRHHHEGLPSVFRAPASPARDAGLIADWLHDPTILVLVAEHGADAVGFLQAYVRHPPDLPIFVGRAFVQVDGMVVSSAHRRHGVGSMLLTEAEKWAQSQGIYCVELNVFAFNQSAVSFYRRNGYGYFSHRMIKDLTGSRAQGSSAEA